MNSQSGKKNQQNNSAKRYKENQIITPNNIQSNSKSKKSIKSPNNKTPLKLSDTNSKTKNTPKDSNSFLMNQLENSFSSQQTEKVEKKFTQENIESSKKNKENISKESEKFKSNLKEFLSGRKPKLETSTNKNRNTFDNIYKGKLSDLDYENENEILKENFSNKKFEFKINYSSKKQIQRFNRLSTIKNDNDDRVCVSDEEIKELKSSRKQSNSNNSRNLNKNSAKKIFKKFLNKETDEEFNNNSNSDSDIALKKSNEKIKKTFNEEKRKISLKKKSSVKKENDTSIELNKIQSQKSKVLKIPFTEEIENSEAESESEEEKKVKKFNRNEFLNSMKMFKELCGQEIPKEEINSENNTNKYNNNFSKEINNIISEKYFEKELESVNNFNNTFNNILSKEINISSDKNIQKKKIKKNKKNFDDLPPPLLSGEEEEEENTIIENSNLNSEIKEKLSDSEEENISILPKSNKFTSKLSTDFYKRKKGVSNYKKDSDEEEENKLAEDFIEAEAEIEIEEDLFKKNRKSYTETEKKIKEKYNNQTQINKNNFENDEFFNEEIDKVYRHRQEFSLANYQIELLNWMNRRGNVIGTAKGGIISLPMGSGKTFTTLCKVMKDFQESNRPSLIVVPKSILSVWTEEIEKFFPENECPYVIYNKNAITMHKKFTIDILKKVKIILTTYPFILGGGKKLNILESVVQRGQKGNITKITGKRLPKREPNYSRLFGYNLLFNFVFENVICDESHKFSNLTSKTFYSLLNLYSKKHWCLTGNLIMNQENDVDSQLLFIGVNNIDLENSDKMRYVFYREGINSLINLPDKKIHKEIIPLSKIEQEFYNYYKKSYRKAFEKDYGIFEDISCMLVVIMRFRQLCVHPFLLDKGKSKNKKKEQGKLNFDKLQDDIEDNIPKDVKKWLLEDLNKITSSTKVIRAVEIIRNIPEGEKVIIFSFFTDTFLQIEDYMKLINLKNVKTAKIEGKDKDYEREITIDRFRNDPNIKVLFLTFSIGSCGLNLFCANNIIMMDLWWNFAVFDQSIARIYRNGQTRPVNIYVLCIQNSIDLYLWELIDFKREILKSLTTNQPMEKDKSKTRQLFEDVLYNDDEDIKRRKRKLGEENFSD